MGGDSEPPRRGSPRSSRDSTPPRFDVPSDKSKSPLVLEFNRKLQAALQLSQDDVGREAKRMYNVAFLPYKPLDLNATLSLEPALKLPRLSSASKFRALEDGLLVPDADDPERS